ncbi:hypothetical protein [Chloroflexus sp.]
MQRSTGLHHQRGQRIFALLIFGLVCGVFFAQIYYGIRHWSNATPPDEWHIGEWLINYQGGFTRRGLPGEIILQLSRWLMINPAHLTILIQTGVFTLFLLLAYILLRNTERSVIAFTLLFSPAFLLFPLLEWPRVGVRKEVFLFIMFIIQLLWLRSARLYTPVLLLFIGVGALFAVLSHEMLVIFLPYLVIATICAEQRFGRLSLATIIALIPAIVAAIIIFRNPQTTTAAIDAICASLGSSAPYDCLHQNERLGAITFLAQSTGYGIAFTRHFTTTETTLVYLITGSLSLIPLLLAIAGYRLWQYLPPGTIIWIGGVWGLSIVATIPLFVVAADYGRFINIHITCSTLLLAWLIQARQARPIFASATAGWWIAAILFAGSWRLPMWLSFATYTHAFSWLSLF